MKTAMSSDEEREYAIKQAGIALEEAQREVERCTARFDESGLFADMADLYLAVERITRQTGRNPGTVEGLSRKTHKRDTDTAWSRSNSGVG